MSTSPTLPIGPFEHPALDYAQLRAEGIRLLGRLTGDQWTDYNAHDPGITILEQLCYSITDLAYRIDHPIPDLLAGSDLSVALPGPARILTCDPVTRNDLRKLVLDVAGVADAWIEPGPEPSVFHHTGSGELRLRADTDDPQIRPVRLSGVHRVLLQTAHAEPGAGNAKEEAIERVADRLHAQRGLGEDFALELVATHEVWIAADVEVGTVEDPAATMADVIEQIERHLAPPVRFTAPDDALAAGSRIDELFEGPALQHGFLCAALPEPRRTIGTSDLIHAIMDAPGVRAVRSLVFGDSSIAGFATRTLQIPPGHIATLSPRSEIVLTRAGLKVQAHRGTVAELRAKRQGARALTHVSHDAMFEPTPGRDRRLDGYHSLQHQLPAAYGLGVLGLPDDAPARRHAQARQLEAYLLIFDQLLAAMFAQVAHARDLLSPDEGLCTYFVKPVEDPRLRLDEVRRQDLETHRAWLEEWIESTVAGDPVERRKRFLAHLLARFAEQVGEHVHIAAPPVKGADRLIAARVAFLRDYPRLSSARGSGPDLRKTDSEPVLAQRIRIKLGRPQSEHLRFHVVEHVLLRPIPEDARQLGGSDDPHVVLLAGVAEPDPWSLQVSFVFADRAGGAPGDEFETLVAQTIVAETPAHLRAHLRWFGSKDWDDFDKAWRAFRSASRAYRTTQVLATQVPDAVHQRFRDARDRLIDLLELGRTYPLRDLPVTRYVASGRPIEIQHSQRHVLYSLYKYDDGAKIKVYETWGTGGTIELPTPKAGRDTSYRIFATKDKDEDGVWLHGDVRVEEGVDVTLRAQILAMWLHDRRIDAPRQGDACLVPYGAIVEVELLKPQEGVRYELVADTDRAHAISQEPIVGISKRGVLRTTPLTEDIDLRIRARKDVGDPGLGKSLIDVLDLVLAVHVEADLGLVAKLVPAAVIPHKGTASVQLNGTQKSAAYSVYRRRLRDHEFVFGAPSQPTIDVPGDDGRTIRLERPAGTATWTELERIGEEQTGTGDTLVLPLPPLVEDSLLFIRASKRHTPSSATITSVQLDQVLALLVRPDPAHPLRIRTTLAGGATTGPLLLSDGQPGVFYTLRRDGIPRLLQQPRYFHQRDDADDRFNKGIGQLRVEVDLAIAREPDAPPTNRATSRPLPPLVDGPLPVGTVLRVTARKAISGLVADLERVARIAVPPTLVVEPATVRPSQAATIVVATSVLGARYRLLRAETSVDEAEGTGGRIELATGPLDRSTAFELEIVSPPGEVRVESRIPIMVTVN